MLTANCDWKIIIQGSQKEKQDTADVDRAIKENRNSI